MRGCTSIRSAEHTGENRCWPCTLVNLLLVGLFVAMLRVRGRRVAGLAAATLGVGLVYFRGYTVPYTPVFAPQLVAASPLPDDLFHGGRIEPVTDERESLTATDLDGEAVLGELAAAGVVEPDGEMLFLTDDVEAAWHDEMDRLADRSLAALAAAVSRAVPGIAETDAFRTEDRDWVVLGESEELVARPVAVAELAAYRALELYLDDETVRLAGARSLRMFLEDCPVCDTPLVESSEVSCCGGYTKPRQSPDDVLVCPTCEQRLFTFSGEA